MYADAARTDQALHFPLPPDHAPNIENAAWLQERRALLCDWGRKRERKMHRPPMCLMDQMTSGSGFYPIRLLEDSWLTPAELDMVSRLEGLLQGTVHAHTLARDMLTPLVFGVDVRIVLDNSGSMNLDMFGIPVTRGVEGENCFNQYTIDQALRNSLKPGWFADPSILRSLTPARGGPSPFHQRWWFARDALRHWMQVYSILGIDPWVYLLNGVQGIVGKKLRGSQLEQVFQRSPSGSTPMTEAIQDAVQDHKGECPDRPLLILALTDGEADNMISFNRVLDEIQNLVHGDVQVCLMGLSLVKADIEWFENEECDETRIRTVEAFEVENRQIQLKEVVKKEGGYNFEMHTYRVLVTNFFPADYDYEAPLQNLRHRLYITLHGRDRWYGLNNLCWKCAVSNLACAACFIATGAHGCGWCQGNECGKWQWPEMLEDCFDE